MPTWFVYVLKGCARDLIYVRSTNNYARRPRNHNRSTVQSSKAYRPLELVAYVGVRSPRKA
jgi:predicted GIY-YIG superfamily endonuclease